MVSSFLELINEGNIGLLKAARRFNLENKVKFISYAVWWIRQPIQKALFEQTGTVRIPPNKIALLAKFKKALDRVFGALPCNDHRRRFKEHEQDLIDVMDKLRGASLDAPVSNTQSAEGDSTKTLLDVLGEERNQDVESERRELGKVIDSVLENITSREERILRMYYGLIFSSSSHLKKSARNLSLPESEHASLAIAPSGSFSETLPLAQSQPSLSRMSVNRPNEEARECCGHILIPCLRFPLAECRTLMHIVQRRAHPEKNIGRFVCLARGRSRWLAFSGNISLFAPYFS